MSLSRMVLDRWVCGFPRVSGDEPQELIKATGAVVFSPRERG